MSQEGYYYLGRSFDPQAGQTTAEPVLYDSQDLTTHGVIVGMTGSGKTGLGLVLLEEAALSGVPALLIDPKGDITNLLLHFPDLAPADFQPWINVDQARREGKSPEQAAAETAALWRDGLAKWGIDPARIAALKTAAQFTIYTPGSDAGKPVSILASLKAPGLAWEGNRELLREKISSTVTALLGLVGFSDIDPVRSREHILLSNIFDLTWSQGHDLTLSELIMQTQTPPFTKLGVFDVNTFFPEKERFELAMMLNNILAAPSFQTWIEGEPLDIQSLLYTPSGKPRHSIFYIAHLDDAERMFFVSLLFSAVESWMRGQSGSTSLRALVYFDEIFGYLPPVSNPPSKETLLRMLKQARAFGVGLVLATQNPVDIDYKALSNAGSWFIGKLQTDQDKQRLLDGLTGAAGELDRAAYDALLSGLGKRVFLLHNVHEKGPSLLQTRWAMNYLAGPLTRTQIPALNALAGAGEEAPAAAIPAAGITTPAPATGPAKEAPTAAGEEMALGSRTAPSAPRAVMTYFLPNNLSLSQAAKAGGLSLGAGTKQLGLRYRPVLLAQASARFLNRKYDLDHLSRRTALVPEPDRRGVVHWDAFPAGALDPRELDRGPLPEAFFANLEEPFSDDKTMAAAERDFLDWVYRSSEVRLPANEELGIYGRPDEPPEAFEKRCAEAAAAAREQEMAKTAASFDQKLDRLEDKLAREERELREDEAELAQRKREEGLAHAETLLSIFSKRRRSLSSSMSKRRMTERASADVEESVEEIQAIEADMKALEEEMADALAEIEARWQEIAAKTTEIPVQPFKKDINLELFGLAWFPYHVLESDGRQVELPGFDLPQEG